jgi:glutamate 5-kinase
MGSVLLDQLEGRAAKAGSRASPPTLPTCVIVVLSAAIGWIAGALAPLRTFIVDAGAARALAGGLSLLPTGVRAVGALSNVATRPSSAGPTVLRSPAVCLAYASGDAGRIAGHRCDEIEAILGCVAAVK